MKLSSEWFVLSCKLDKLRYPAQPCRFIDCRWSHAIFFLAVTTCFWMTLFSGQVVYNTNYDDWQSSLTWSIVGLYWKKCALHSRQGFVQHLHCRYAAYKEGFTSRMDLWEEAKLTELTPYQVLEAVECSTMSSYFLPGGGLQARFECLGVLSQSGGVESNRI